MMTDRIPVQQAVNGVISFLSGEVAKIQDMTSKWIMYGALGAMKANPDAMVAQHMDALKTVGIVDGKDMTVDIGALQGALVNAFANVPTFKMLGFTFTEDDVAELLRHISRQ